MSVRNMIMAMAEWVPQRVKVAMRGKRAAPRGFANAVHSILNRVPGEKFPVLSCVGALEGFRMKVDWDKHRAFAHGTWEPDVVQSISQSVAPGMTVLDIGAHGGFYALLLAKLVGSKGKVIAFEPLPANFRLLEENVKLNAVDNIIPKRDAVSDCSGELDLEVPDADALLLAGELRDDDERGTTRVPAISLDDFVSQTGLRVDFVKMDVEGAEGAILKGAGKVLDNFHPCMMIELHDLDKQAGLHPVVVHLNKLGYKLEWLGEVGSTAHVLARWTAKT